MLCFTARRIVKMVCNSSNLRRSNPVFRNYKNISRLLSTDSVSKVDIDIAQDKVNLKKENSLEDNSNFYIFVKEANKIGLDTEKFTDSLKDCVVYNIGSDRFLKNAKVLIDFGFSGYTVTQFINECQSLFQMENAKLCRLLEMWRDIGIREEIVIELLSLHPQFIEIMGPTVTDRIALLLPYFEKTNVVATLFINSPRVVYENWGTLKAKLDFLHSYNIPMKKVANCNALDLSLLEMKTRFTFLERAGMYKRLVDLFKKDLKVNNASVRNILCTDDKLFAETVARLTLIEYEAFVELYKMEFEALDEENYDGSDSE